MFSSGNSSFQLYSAAESLNDYFLVTVEKLNIEKVDIHSALLFFNNLSSQDLPLI
jgi:hypothetical protein